MKYSVLLILVLLVFQLTYAQETKPVSKKSGVFQEEFYVLVTDKKIKHGSYKKYKDKDQLIIEGAYDNNVKTGEWRFYANGELEQSFDFTKKEIRNIKKPDYTSNAWINGAIQEVQLDSPPSYAGSKVALTHELNNVMTYPYQSLLMGVGGKVLVSVWINENGELSNPKIIQGINSECNEDVIKGLTKMEKNWIAGTKDGQNVNSELFIVIELKLHDNGDKTITAL